MKMKTYREQLHEELLKDTREFCCYCMTERHGLACCGEVHYVTYCEENDKLRALNQEFLEALSMWLRLHETPAGYEGKYGKALDAAITAQQVKIDAAANAARAAIAKATGEQA